MQEIRSHSTALARMGKRRLVVVRTACLAFSLLFGLIFLLFPARFAGAYTPPTPGTVLGRVEPSLLRQLLQTPPHERVRFVVELRAPPGADGLASPNGRRGSRPVVERLQTIAEQSQRGVRVALAQAARHGYVGEVTLLWIINGLVVSATPQVAFDLAGRPDVAWLRAERTYTLPSDQTMSRQAGGPVPEWNISHIRADLANQALGLDGRGVVVAILDTGVDGQHPALRSAYRGYNPKGFPDHQGNWFDVTDEQFVYPGDGIGHGTHVMGTILGDDGESRTGVAPGARWIAAKIFNAQGVARETWIHQAFQWVLAPAGDPDLAPDIVNGSWGSTVSGNEEFRRDLQTLRAAGILPVFAAGNGGPLVSSIYSPGSLVEALTVGATDELDVVAEFSSRGPTPWGDTKPDVMAPGTNIRSSAAGGSYAVRNGTSMAAPHVTGLAALLLQADPALSLDQLEAIITGTARPLADPSPDNVYGWGLVDAYQAGLVATSSGVLAGEIRRQVDGASLTHGEVRVLNRDGELQLIVPGDSEGRFRAAIAPGTYDLEATAFAYGRRFVQGVRIRSGVTTTQVFTLTPLPAGVLFGRVTEACPKTESCEEPLPLGATIAAEGTPVTATTDPASGLYGLALPEGVYTVTTTSWGHRVSRTTAVEVLADAGTLLNVALPLVPTVLFVDGGRWYYDYHGQIIADTLERLGYLFHRWPIRHPFDTPGDVPTAGDLARYDVVIWDAPQDSPGLVGATHAITGYLSAGGNLLVTGQDVGYWDDGGDPLAVPAAYFRPYLKARYVRDDAGLGDVIGQTGDILDGLTLRFNTGDSGANQSYPDEITVLDTDHAVPIAANTRADPLAVRASTCLSYRSVALGFGLEGVGPAEARADALERILRWFVAPRPPVGAQLTLSSPVRVVRPGNVITHSMRLRNRGATTDTFTVGLAPSAWPTTLWIGGSPGPPTATVSLGSCATETLTLEVRVPPDISWDEADQATVSARSALSPTVWVTATATTKTPAPILLVDDDRWYNQESAYEQALAASDLRYDYWDTQLGYASPPTAVLNLHPIVVWFTGYDWVDALSVGEEQKLTQFLEGGGRLLFSSQDYLYTNGLNPFGAHYLGVLTYTEGLTTTLVTGVPGHPAGDGLGPFLLGFPFPNFSDALEPAAGSEAAFTGSHGQPVAITTDAGEAGFATAFFAFPLEALAGDPRAQALGRTVAWLSPLGTSTFGVDRGVVRSGSAVTFTAWLINRGPDVRTVTFSNTLPAGLTLVPGSLDGGAVFDPEATRALWTGPVGDGQSHRLSYRAVVRPIPPEGRVVVNVAEIDDGTRLTFLRAATLEVDLPELGASTKVVSPAVAEPGDTLHYAIHLRNDGVVPADGLLTDVVPAMTAYVPGSLWASAGSAQIAGSAITWTMRIEPGKALTLTYQTVVDGPAPGRVVINEAVLHDGFGRQLHLRAEAIVPARLRLPAIRRD